MTDYSIPTDKEIAEKIKALIIADLSINYSIPALAAKGGTNPTGLKRVFKNRFGITVANFSKQVRIEKAKELLTTTNNTLQMIAETVGYTEGNNFQLAFKKSTGLTPGEWRKKYQPK